MVQAADSFPYRLTRPTVMLNLLLSSMFCQAHHSTAMLLANLATHADSTTSQCAAKHDSTLLTCLGWRTSHLPLHACTAEYKWETIILDGSFLLFGKDAAMH